MLPSNKLKKNKLNYCKKFLIYLKAQITDTNIFPFQRYKLYKDVIIPKIEMKLKKRNRKGKK